MFNLYAAFMGAAPLPAYLYQRPRRNGTPRIGILYYIIRRTLVNRFILPRRLKFITKTGSRFRRKPVYQPAAGVPRRLSGLFAGLCSALPLPASPASASGARLVRLPFPSLPDRFHREYPRPREVVGSSISPAASGSVQAVSFLNCSRFSFLRRSGISTGRPPLSIER